MLGQAVVVYCLTQSQNWPFLGLKTTLKATDSAPRLQFQFTSLFSPPGKYWANFDNQFITLLSQVTKPGLDAQPVALRPVHNIILCPPSTSSPACTPSTAIPGLPAAFVVSHCRPCARRCARTQTGNDNLWRPAPSPCSHSPRPSRACCPA